jgi:hypothetical protein
MAPQNKKNKPLEGLSDLVNGGGGLHDLLAAASSCISTSFLA